MVRDKIKIRKALVVKLEQLPEVRTKRLPDYVEIGRPITLVRERLPVPRDLVVKGDRRRLIVLLSEFRVQDSIAKALAHLTGDQDVDLAVGCAVGDHDIRHTGKEHLRKPAPEGLRQAVAVRV